MGVSENNAHYGHRLRVYRKIGDEIYDEVYYLTVNGKPVTKKREREIRSIAKARDKELLNYQTEYQQEMESANPVKFHQNGRIIGLTHPHKRSETQTGDIFKLRIRLPNGNISWGSISIDLYGFDEAYAQAIQRIVEALSINKRTKIYRRMKAAQEFY
ncbi:MAG: hypothetical protein KAI02_01260 [Gammaproteobacteria bacterium]|nr:hypothetical protein [Gammaproteobacteria bacterium]